MAAKKNEAHRERKRQLSEVRRELARARSALRETHRQVRAFVQETRASVQEHARQVHRHVTEALRATVKSDKQAAQAAHAARLSDIRGIDSDLVRVSAKAASADQLKQDLAAAESAYLKVRSSAPPITCLGVRAETDAEVREHLPEELIPLFQRMRHAVKPGPKCSRTVSFLTYAFAHPEEVTAAAKHPHHVEVTELEQREVRLSMELARHEEKLAAEAAAPEPSRAIVLAPRAPTAPTTTTTSTKAQTPTGRTPVSLRVLPTPKGAPPRLPAHPSDGSRRRGSASALRAKPVQLEHESLGATPLFRRPIEARVPGGGSSQRALALSPGLPAVRQLALLPAGPALLSLRAVPALPRVPKKQRLSGATASYDPGDNKLRMRSTSRLDPELYRRMKGAGFSWAPKQQVFVAPAWTPERETLLLELCGEIGDEDTSLVERAEGRAGRFEGYKERRAGEAEGARRAVEEVSKRFEFGQPILVGHHSERRARKDAERIESGMRKAVSLWQTSQYWEERAKGALRHAKNKERPDVRHRRIKSIDSDRRKEVREKEDAEHFRKLWTECTTLERAMGIANYDHLSTPEVLGPDGKVVSRRSTYWSALKDGDITVEWARTHAIQAHDAQIRRCDRWIEHLDHRLAYERAMLNEGGGIPAAKFDLQVGGQVLERYGWATIVRLNRKGGEVVSATVESKHGKGVCGIEEIRDYRPPAEGDTAKVAAMMKLAPLVNFPGDGFRAMTQAEWAKRAKVSDFYSARRVAATETHGAYRLRMAPKEGGASYTTVGVYITDAKRVDPPAPSSPLARPGLPVREREVPPSRPAPAPPAKATVFDAMEKSLKAGVKVVSADQLFPTPPELARRMVTLAKIQPGERVLEPSAGTGNLVRAVLGKPGAYVVAVEVSPELARALTPKSPGESYSVRHADFLTLGAGELGTFNCVVMNPPFANGADVKHILHARTLLSPGGRLIALCANGPRQANALKSLADTWEELPAGTFKSSGTNVRTVLLTMRAAGSARVPADRAPAPSSKAASPAASPAASSAKRPKKARAPGPKRAPTKLKVVAARKIARKASVKRKPTRGGRKGSA